MGVNSIVPDFSHIGEGHLAVRRNLSGLLAKLQVN